MRIVVNNGGFPPLNQDTVLAGIPAARKNYKKFLESSTDPKSFFEKRKDDATQLIDAFKRHLLPEASTVKRAFRSASKKTSGRDVILTVSAIALMAGVATSTQDSLQNTSRHNVPAGLANPFDTPQTMSLEKWNEAFGNGEKNISIIPKASAAVMPAFSKRVETGPVKAKVVNFGSLAGENMGRWKTAANKKERNLNSLFTGVEGIAPAMQKVDYCEQIKLAWEAKANRKGGVSGATKGANGFVIDQYCNGTKTYMDFDTYLDGVDKRILAVRPQFDFDGLCGKYKIEKDGCHLVRKMESIITSVYIGAYGMTEVPPRQDGKFNIKLLSHLMENGGVEYVMSLPAMYDPLGSKGLFQFTWMGHSNSPEEGRQGAAIIIPFVPKDFKIPESVMGPMGLNTFDHDRAAHYFMLYNTVALVAKLDKKQRLALKRVINDEKRHIELLDFWATSHHAPGSVRKYAKRWLSGGATKPFHNYLKGRFVKYSKKSRDGFVSLTNHREGYKS